MSEEDMRVYLILRNWLLDRGFEFWAEIDALVCPDNPEGSMIPYALLKEHGSEILELLPQERGAKIRELQQDTTTEDVSSSDVKDCACGKK